MAPARDDLPGLPALVPGFRRRRRRRPAGRARPAAVPAAARRRRGLAVAVLPLPDGRLRLRRLRSLRCRPALRHARRLRRAGAGSTPPRAPADPRLRPEPHLDRAPVVPRAPGALPLARRDAGRAADELGQQLRRIRLGVGRAARRLVLPRLPARAAGPGLAQPGRARGHARRPPVLGRARRRRLPDRRAAPDDQGRPLARQPAEPGLARGRRPLSRAHPRVHDRPRRGARARRAHARRGRP